MSLVIKTGTKLLCLRTVMPQSDFPAGGVSDAPTSVLIGQVVLNTSVTATGIVRH